MKNSASDDSLNYMDSEDDEEETKEVNFIGEGKMVDVGAVIRSGSEESMDAVHRMQSGSWPQSYRSSSLALFPFRISMRFPPSCTASLLAGVSGKQGTMVSFTATPLLRPRRMLS
ncbi:hypothetical protein LINPERHAP1_LOCUS36557 [Linum perenne]